MGKPVYFLVIFALLLTSALPAASLAADPASTSIAAQKSNSEGELAGMPAWPVPAQPIPYHEPGHASPAASYSTYVERVNAEGSLEAEQISGLGAMMADEVIDDPLAGNYRLVSMDKVFIADYQEVPGGSFNLRTYAVSPTMEIPGSQFSPGIFNNFDVAAGDLNGDAIDEQIATWIQPGEAPSQSPGHIYLDIGDMQGAITNTRTTSAPAGVLRADNVLDLVVRGYDDAMWHRQYDVGAGTWGDWNNLAGGLLLSAPTITSRGDNQLDAFAIGIDDSILPNYLVIWSNHYSAGSWEGWVPLDNPDENNPPAIWPTVGNLVPIPTIPAPAVVARGNQLDLFWLWTDNTLLYRHYTGSSWDAWQNLGGELSSGPGAVAVDASHITVFAGGVDGALWYRMYAGSWSDWKRVPMAGMPSEVTFASAPTAISPQTGKIAVYVRGSDNALWKNVYNGSAWEGWEPQAGVLASGVGVAASQVTNTIWLYAQDPAGSLQQGVDSGIGYPLWEPGWSWLTNCCQSQPYDTGLLGYFEVDPQLREDNYNNVAVRTGNLFGDGRQQIVLAYRRTANEVGLQVFDIKDGFVPRPLLLEDINRSGVLPKLTLGDFNADGRHEIGFIYFDENAFTVNIDVFSLNTTDWTLTILDSAVYDAADFPAICGGNPVTSKYSERTMNIASGDLDGNGDAEIVISWDVHVYCNNMRYQATESILDVTADGILNMNSERYNQPGFPAVAPGSGNIELAVGDINGNGVDEVIRTWPQYWPDGTWPRLHRHLQIIDASNLSDPIPPLLDYEIPNWSDVTGRDELAVDDLNRDLVEEIVFFESDSDTDPDLDKLWFYQYQQDSLVALGDPFLFDNYYLPEIATGDFTGDSLRVGPPSYRRQYGVGDITAVINAPPKHTDVLNGVTYDINSNDPETRAVLTREQGTTTNVSISTRREFSLATDFTFTIGAPEATHTRDSIEMSYGAHFEETEGAFETVNFSQNTYAINDDALVYMRTNYDLWEYPVFKLNSDVPASYLTVIFPMDTPTMVVDTGDDCDSWYRSRHQLDNAWTYPASDASFYDLAQTITDRDSYRLSDGVAHDFSYLFESGEVSSYASEVQMGISNEFEWQIGGEEVTVSLFDVVQFSTRMPSFMWSMRTAYNQAELSTLEITSYTSTEVQGYLNTIPTGPGGLTYDYFVRPYLYWSTNGAMVLDYTTDPVGTWWSEYDLPDPGFIYRNCPGNKALFSYDVVVDPPVASEGDVITATAVVRNFSNQDNHVPFLVSFYNGDPDAGGTWIADKTVAAYALGPREVLPVSTQWTASGAGEQRIYAVIDSSGALQEIHDESGDFINNNKAFGLLEMGRVDFVEVGVNSDQAYHSTDYALADTLQVSINVPPANLAETIRVDLSDIYINIRNVVGNPFEVAAYIGSDDGNPATEPWESPVPNYLFRAEQGMPPASITIHYGDGDIAGFNENSLTLFRQTSGGWVEGTCPGYSVQRFTSDNMLVVPICQAGIYALSVTGPYWPTYLAIMVK